MAQEADVVGSSVAAREFKRQPFGIEVKLAPPGKPLHLAAASLAERQQWMDALRLAAEGALGCLVPSIGLFVVQDRVSGLLRVENVQVGSSAHAVGVISRGHLIVAVAPVVAEVFSKMQMKACLGVLHGPPGSTVTLTMRDPTPVAGDQAHTPYVVTIERRAAGGQLDAAAAGPVVDAGAVQAVSREHMQQVSRDASGAVLTSISAAES